MYKYYLFILLILTSFIANASGKDPDIIINNENHYFTNGFTFIGRNETKFILKNPTSNEEFFSVLIISRDNFRLKNPSIIYSESEKLIYESIQASNSESYSIIHIKPKSTLTININNLNTKNNDVFVGKLKDLNRHLFEERFFSGASFCLNIIIFISLIGFLVYTKEDIIFKIIIAQIFHFLAIIFSKAGFIYIDLNLITAIELSVLASWAFAFSSVSKNNTFRIIWNIISIFLFLFSIFVISFYEKYNNLINYLNISQHDFLILYNIIFFTPIFILSVIFSIKKNRLALYFSLISITPFFQIPIKHWGLLPTNAGFFSILKSSYSYQITISIIIIIGVIDYTSKVFRERNQAKFEIQANEVNKNKMLFQLKESELNLFRQEINPHFLFNSINNISYMVDVDKEKSKNMLNKLSQIYRRFVSFPKKNSIPISEELIIVYNYLDIEIMRFGKRLSYNIVTDEIKNLEKVYIPPLMMQTLVENSIKHGISKIREGGSINIKIYPDKEGYIFEIENPIKNSTSSKNKINELEKNENENENENETKHEGNGLKNTQKRLELIYGKQRANFQIIVQNDVFKVSFWFSGIEL